MIEVATQRRSEDGGRPIVGVIRRLAPVTLATLATLALGLPPAAARAGRLDELRTCMAANVPKKSSSLSFRLVSRFQEGHETTHRGHLFWKPTAGGESRTLVCLSAPRDVRGLAYLVHEHADGQTVWGYLPEKETVFRITAQEAARRGRIGRTAIGYEDLRYLPLNLSEARAVIATDAPEAGRPTDRVELALAPGSDVNYSRIEASIDRESCAPLDADLYASDGKLVKAVRADPDTLTQKGVRFARALTVEDKLQKVETQMLVEELRVDEDLPEKMFTANYLKRGRCP
jgi:hypothetical protein